MRIWTYCLLLLVTLPAQAQDQLDQLAKRIEELEKQQQELLYQSATDSQSGMNSFLKDKLTFGGFFEPAYTIISGPDTDTQATNSVNLLGINLAAEYGPRLRFVSQFVTALGFNLANEHNHPNPAGGQPEKREYTSPVFATLLTQGYLEYTFNSRYHLQGGLGYVPFGYSFQQREPVLFIRRGGPQVLRTRNIVNPLWSGLNLQARFPQKNSTWGYSLYTFSPIEHPKHPGIGARGYWASADDKVTAGLSTQVGKLGAKNFETVGTDLRLNLSPFLITAEYAYGFFEGDDPWSFYLEPAMYMMNEELLFYVFGDFTDNKENRSGGSAPGSFSDPYRKWEYGFGMNWLPTAFTRIRLGITFHDYIGKNAVIEKQNRDYTSIDISAGVAF